MGSWISLLTGNQLGTWREGELEGDKLLVACLMSQQGGRGGSGCFECSYGMSCV